MGKQGRSILSLIFGNIILQIAIMTLLFWLYHNYAADLMTKGVVKFGALNARTVPLYADIRINISKWLIPAVVSLMAYMVLFGGLFQRPKFPCCLNLLNTLRRFCGLAS